MGGIPDWPRFEDGSLVTFGDEVLARSGKGFVAHCVHFYDGSYGTAEGAVIGSGHGYGVKVDGPVTRPTEEQMADYYRKWPEEKEGRDG